MRERPPAICLALQTLRLQTLREAGFRALLAVPLIRERRVVGDLTIRRKTAGSIPAGPTTPAFARHHRVRLEHSIRRFRASFAGDVRSTYQILEVTAMPIAYLEPTRASAEAIETTPAVATEPEMLPAATMLLVPYAIDEVEWHQVDERFPQR